MLASYVLTLVDAIRQATPDKADSILRNSGILPHDLEFPDGRIPIAAVDALWSEAIAQTGDTYLGLRVGSMARPASFSQLGRLLMTAPTLGAAMSQATRLSVLVGPDLAVRLETSHSAARFMVYSLTPNLPHSTCRVEAVMAATLAFAREATRTELAPLRVCFSHGGGNEKKIRYREYFSSPVSFGAADNSMEISAEALSLPVSNADTSLNRTLVESAEGSLRLQLGIDPIRYQVRKEVQVEFTSGETPRLENVSTRLAISPRSLQRRLHLAGSSLNSETAIVRQELAYYYLKHTDLSIETIALQLGYSELSAFTRAYRRWTGQAPSGHRNAAVLPQSTVLGDTAT